MNYYETLFIVRQEATTSQVETATNELVALIEEKGGKIARREYWGLRNLAYRIRKSRKGHYVLLNYESSSEAVDAIKYRMRYSDDVVRDITIRTEDLPTDDSVQMRANEDDERGRDRDSADKTDRPKQDKGFRPRPSKATDDDDTAPDEAIDEGAEDSTETNED